MDRRAELERYIADTRRLQRRMAIVFAALALVAIVMFAWSTAIGVLSLICVALIAICSFWVTAAHNATHQQKLDELARTGGKGVPTGHRRWHAKR